MSITGSHYHSRVFGFNIPRYVALIVLLVICAYLFWNNDVVGAVILALLILAIFAFNISIDASPHRIKISALWIPLRTFGIDEIKSIEVLSSSPLSERATLGIHFIEGSLSYHSGPATIRITTYTGKSIRVTAAHPASLLELTNQGSARIP